MQAYACVAVPHACGDQSHNSFILKRKQNATVSPFVFHGRMCNDSGRRFLGEAKHFFFSETSILKELVGNLFHFRIENAPHTQTHVHKHARTSCARKKKKNDFFIAKLNYASPNGQFKFSESFNGKTVFDNAHEYMRQNMAQNYREWVPFCHRKFHKISHNFLLRITVSSETLPS